MVKRAFGPTVRALPSRNTRCARSLADVVTSSLACTSIPMRRMRSFSLGGLPRGSPSALDVTPIGAASMTPEVTVIIAKPIRAAGSNRADQRVVLLTMLLHPPDVWMTPVRNPDGELERSAQILPRAECSIWYEFD